MNSTRKLSAENSPQLAFFNSRASSNDKSANFSLANVFRPTTPQQRNTRLAASSSQLQQANSAARSLRVADDKLSTASYVAYAGFALLSILFAWYQLVAQVQTCASFALLALAGVFLTRLSDENRPSGKPSRNGKQQASDENSKQALFDKSALAENGKLGDQTSLELFALESRGCEKLEPSNCKHPPNGKQAESERLSMHLSTQSLASSSLDSTLARSVSPPASGSRSYKSDHSGSTAVVAANSNSNPDSRASSTRVSPVNGPQPATATTPTDNSAIYATPQRKPRKVDSRSSPDSATLATSLAVAAASATTSAPASAAAVADCPSISRGFASVFSFAGLSRAKSSAILEKSASRDSNLSTDCEGPARVAIVDSGFDRGAQQLGSLIVDYGAGLKQSPASPGVTDV